ncbi:DUF222 domain-containing protein [Leucobacter coleopterorum]|uniref:DUF222 domain-containing protein n=1 Tax=Leucobacter coleopterorum TaxID=2714933 RepID=A0ABX6JX83_9MICO|nr:DUF222 domain-containing protein [Leucobacter coleopterorum]QIM18925.1 DUF222 domain-containing protein [Leucobacter coleopterorum]
MSSNTNQGMGSLGSVRRVFDEQSPYVLALGVLMNRLETTEQTLRELEAERTAILSEVYQLAVAESDGLGADTPSGKSGELAYRAVRAEVAMVLGVGERGVDRQLSQAELLHRAYPRVSEALADAHISYRHAEVILDAGNVIGSGDDSSTVGRRADYENAVLAFAVEETPLG